MNLIVTVDEKWGIGEDGGLLAHLPEDMKCFGETTRRGIVVTGRRTLESLPGGKLLKNRVNVVLSKDEAYIPEGARMYHSVEGMSETSRDCRGEDMSTIGGGMIYRESLPYCSKVYMAYVHRAFDVDTAFENLGQDEDWKLESVGDGREHEDISFEFRVHRRAR